MISQLMKDLIKEANKLLILKRGDALSSKEIKIIVTEMSIEDMEHMVDNLKRDEVRDLIIATDDE